MTLSVGGKLNLLAGLSLLGIVILGLVSQLEMNRVYASASYANDNTVPSLLVLDQATDHLASRSQRFWQRLVQTDPVQAAELERAMLEDRQAIDRALKDYEPLLSDQKDRELLAADREALQSMDDLLSKGSALINANRKDEARDLAVTNEAVVQAALAAFKTHRQYNQELGRQGALDGRHVKNMALVIGLAGALVVAACVLLAAVVIRRAITQPLHEAGKVLAQIEKGSLENTIRVTTQDELGTLLGGLDRMQTALRERTARERTTALENARIRTALDRVSTGAMLVDPTGRIIYTNDAAQMLFRNRAADLRSKISSFDPEHVLGGDITSLVPEMSAKLDGNHSAEIQFGGAVFRLTANPVTDTQGQRVGTVFQWFDRTQEVAIEKQVQTTVSKAIEGDLTLRIDEQGEDGFFRTLATGMNRLLDNVCEIVRTMSTAASELKTGAEEISSGNASLSQRTDEQASSLEETASSMEQMTATVKQTADNASQANHLAVAAREQAEKGGAVVGAAVTAMGQINASSKRIADIIGVIDEIAFQTNLLALNAAVEAARAGEQGRGFAVVATEVRSLAGRSASAAKEIKTLIQDSVTQVEEGSKLVDASGQALGDIMASVKKVTDIVAEIAAASREQSSGIDQVNKAVMQMDETTQQNAALVEQAAAASEAIVEQAAALNAVIARYVASKEVAAESAKGGRTTRVIAERRGKTRPWSGGAAGYFPSKGPSEVDRHTGG